MKKLTAINRLFMIFAAAAIGLFTVFVLSTEHDSTVGLQHMDSVSVENLSPNLNGTSWAISHAREKNRKLVNLKLSSRKFLLRRNTTPGGQKSTKLPFIDTQITEISVENGTEFSLEPTSPSLQPILKDESTCLKRSDLLWSKQPSLLRPSRKMCPLLFRASQADSDPHNQELISSATTWYPPKPQTNTSLLNLVSNCSRFLTAVPFQTEPNSREEADFPLAYVFVAHRNTGQSIRHFRMLYQPQNVYCITYDAKSEEAYIQSILAMASCFPSNVYVTPNPEPIYYFGYSILRSVVNCMRVLVNSTIPWRYVQVVSWNDFPLRTNLELVRIFKILNGSQDSELLNLDTPDYVTYQEGNHGEVKRAIPPGGLTYYKGSFANSLSREFIDFMFTNPISLRFYESLEDSKCAEEFYWPSLVHNLWLGAPGAFPGQCEIYYTNAGEKKPFLSRFQVWEWDKGDRQCKGDWINLSCLYGIRDMPMLLKRMEFVAHKVYEEYQPALMYCMEEWYWRNVCKGETHLDWKYYEKLPSVKFHHLSDEEKDKFVCSV